ncbi:MAG TPA: Na-K-Cl cotransporter, partial [Elainellaceae cyanobacterium]
TQLHQAQRNVLILRENTQKGDDQRRRIDVWWGGLHANGGLMLILAYLLRSNINWRRAKIYLKLVVSDELAAQQAQTNLDRMNQSLRIGAIPQVLIAQGRSFEEILHESSQDADMIFLGMATPDQNFAEYYDKIQAWTDGLPTTMFVLAAPEFSSLEVLDE